jgi:SAM-dependent methyltransferase
MLYHRQSESYTNYVVMQGAKINRSGKRYKESNPRYVRAYAKLFAGVSSCLKSGKVLCLGARAGWEVEGAILAGFKGSIGIDLHPGTAMVMKADWHDMPFKDNSFENAFTNSIDHCLYFPKLVSEIRRVLVPGGVFFLTATQYEEWKTKPIADRMEKSLEALFWDDTDDLLPEFQKAGFIVFESWRKYSRSFYLMRNEPSWV